MVGIPFINDESVFGIFGSPSKINQTTTTNQTTISPSFQSTSTKTITNTTSNVITKTFSPNYSYSLQVVSGSPYAETTTKKEQTAAATNPTSAPYVLIPTTTTASQTPSVSPSVSVTPSSSATSGISPLMLLLAGGALLGVYLLSR